MSKKKKTTPEQESQTPSTPRVSAYSSTEPEVRHMGMGSGKVTYEAKMLTTADGNTPQALPRSLRFSCHHIHWPYGLPQL